jgi:hypothetical protein
MFELVTDPRHQGRFQRQTIERTPWTRLFYPRSTKGPNSEEIPDLIEWTRLNWERLVLKPERGYSGKGVQVGGIHNNIDVIIDLALKGNGYGRYIVQEKVPLDLWSEYLPELDTENRRIKEVFYQTDFRCLFGHKGLFGFLNRYGNVPTNVGSGGGVQPLAVLRSDMKIDEATKLMNETVLKLDYDDVLVAIEHQKQLALENQFTYLLGPIKIALRPRLLTYGQMNALGTYCSGIWSDCLTMEKMWFSGELDEFVSLEPEELEIIRSQPWQGSSAIFASDGLFNFGVSTK